MNSLGGIFLYSQRILVGTLRPAGWYALQILCGYLVRTITEGYKHASPKHCDHGGADVFPPQRPPVQSLGEQAARQQNADGGKHCSGNGHLRRLRTSTALLRGGVAAAGGWPGIVHARRRV